METLILEETKSTPSVILNPDGILKMEGRSLPENVHIFYDPVEKWISKLRVEVVNFDINLNYFNSASSRKILEILKSLDANNCIKKVNVNWHYEEGDDDALEIGQLFEELLIRTNFRYLEYAEGIEN